MDLWSTKKNLPKKRKLNRKSQNKTPYVSLFDLHFSCFVLLWTKTKHTKSFSWILNKEMKSSFGLLVFLLLLLFWWWKSRNGRKPWTKTNGVAVTDSSREERILRADGIDAGHSSLSFIPWTHTHRLWCGPTRNNKLNWDKPFCCFVSSFVFCVQ